MSRSKKPSVTVVSAEGVAAAAVAKEGGPSKRSRRRRSRVPPTVIVVKSTTVRLLMVLSCTTVYCSLLTSKISRALQSQRRRPSGSTSLRRSARLSASKSKDGKSNSRDKALASAARRKLDFVNAVEQATATKLKRRTRRRAAQDSLQSLGDSATSTQSSQRRSTRRVTILPTEQVSRTSSSRKRTAQRDGAVDHDRPTKQAKTTPAATMEKRFCLCHDAGHEARPDIPACDERDLEPVHQVNLAPQYACQIFQSLYHLEEQCSTQPWTATNAHPVDRRTTVDKMILANDSTREGRSTLFLAVQILDRYAACVDLDQKDYKLAAGTCLFLASKYNGECVHVCRECAVCILYFCPSRFSPEMSSWYMKLLQQFFKESFQCKFRRKEVIEIETDILEKWR